MRTRMKPEEAFFEAAVERRGISRGGALLAFGALALVALAPACKREPEIVDPAPAAAPKASEIRPDPRAAPAAASAERAPAPNGEQDVFTTSAGPLQVVPIVHGTLRLEFGARAVYVDPYKADKLPDSPKADLIVLTHAHPDHYDRAALDKVRGPETTVVAPKVVADQERARGQPSKPIVVLKNGEQRTLAGVEVRAVPMYNLKRGPKPGTLFHEKGVGNGYVLTFGDKRVYVAGDTECTPEMRALQNIDIAFVPMNLPYTMPPEEAAECVRAFRPKVVFPYHYRGSDPAVFARAVSLPEIELRQRDFYAGGE